MQVMTLKLASLFCFLVPNDPKISPEQTQEELLWTDTLIRIYTGSFPLIKLHVSLNLKVSSTISYRT